MKKQTWDDILKPVEPLGENEMTLRIAKEKLGVKDNDSALGVLAELEKAGVIERIGKRKLPKCGKSVMAWKIVER